MKNKIQQYIKAIKETAFISKLAVSLKKNLQTLKHKFMEWLIKTRDNIKQLVWIIPAIVDVRCLIGLGCGILFSIMAFNASETTYKITWSVFAALGNGIFIRYLLEYFGHYPLKERIIENIKTLYSINDFLIKQRNEMSDINLKKLYDYKINEMNFGIQRWGDKIRMADIEKIKNEIKRIECSHEAIQEKLEINITELRKYGISNEVIANFSGTTVQNINNIINTQIELNSKEQRKPKNKKPTANNG